MNTDGTDAVPFLLMGNPKGFVFDLGEGYPTYTLYYDCHGHGVSVYNTPATPTKKRKSPMLTYRNADAAHR